VNVPLGSAFPQGLFVAQNGKAQPPASTDPVNGYDYDNSTQFRLLDWADIATALDLVVDTNSYDPRAAH
jgi:3-phytase